jgi:hypothetical protein
MSHHNTSEPLHELAHFFILTRNISIQNANKPHVPWATTSLVVSCTVDYNISEHVFLQVSYLSEAEFLVHLCGGRKIGRRPSGPCKR